MFRLNVVCPHCKKKIFKDWSQFIVSSDVIEEDRPMGDEIEHIIECDAITCPACGKTFRVSGSVCEYPSGACNDYELDSFSSESK